MPLAFKRLLSPHSHLGLWSVTDTEEALHKLVNPEVLADKRISEASPRMRLQRLAVRALLKELTGSTELVYDNFGKPHFPGGQISLSVTHTNDYVALITSPNPKTGIDIEKIQSRIERIASKFMSDDELKNLEEAHRIEQLHVYWCIKEALYKYYGEKELVFKEHILVKPFTYNSASGICTGCITTKDMNREIRLCYEKVNDHMLAYVLNS